MLNIYTEGEGEWKREKDLNHSGQRAGGSSSFTVNLLLRIVAVN